MRSTNTFPLTASLLHSHYTRPPHPHQLSITFIPFSKERDSLGRLLKGKQTNACSKVKEAKSTQNQNTQSSPLLKSQRNNGLIRYSNNNAKPQGHIQSKILCSFEFKDPLKWGFQGNRIKIRKGSLQLCINKCRDEGLSKLGGPLINKKLPVHQNNRIYNKLQVGQILKPILNTALTQHPPNTYDKPTNNTLNKKTICLDALDCPKRVMNSTNKSMSSYSLKNNLKMEKVAKQIEFVEIKQLKSYNAFKVMELKLAERMMEGHQKFLIKMRQSKKLAHQIKLNLEEDGI